MKTTILKIITMSFTLFLMTACSNSAGTGSGTGSGTTTSTNAQALSNQLSGNSFTMEGYDQYDVDRDAYCKTHSTGLAKVSTATTSNFTFNEDGTCTFGTSGTCAWEALDDATIAFSLTGAYIGTEIWGVSVDGNILNVSFPTSFLDRVDCN